MDIGSQRNESENLSAALERKLEDVIEQNRNADSFAAIEFEIERYFRELTPEQQQTVSPKLAEWIDSGDRACSTIAISLARDFGIDSLVPALSARRAAITKSMADPALDQNDPAASKMDAELWRIGRTLEELEDAQIAADRKALRDAYRQVPRGRRSAPKPRGSRALATGDRKALWKAFKELEAYKEAILGAGGRMLGGTDVDRTPLRPNPELRASFESLAHSDNEDVALASRDYCAEFEAVEKFARIARDTKHV